MSGNLGKKFVLYEFDEAMCDRAMVNFMERIIACWASWGSGGGHMPDIVFYRQT